MVIMKQLLSLLPLVLQMDDISRFLSHRKWLPALRSSFHPSSPGSRPLGSRNTVCFRDGSHS